MAAAETQQQKQLSLEDLHKQHPLLLFSATILQIVLFLSPGVTAPLPAVRAAPLYSCMLTSLVYPFCLELGSKRSVVATQE